MSDKFWHWLRKLSEQKIRNNCKLLQLFCPNCKQWSSIVGVSICQGRIRKGEHYEQFRCHGCQQKTWWLMMGTCARSISDKKMPR